MYISLSPIYSLRSYGYIFLYRCADPLAHLEKILKDIYLPQLQNKKNQDTKVYKRLAFQFPQRDDIRISLDTDMCFIREKHFESQFCTPDEHIDPERDVIHFPYAILELKLKGENVKAPPNWVHDIMNSDMVMRKERFSKFCHGFLLHNCALMLVPFLFLPIDALCFCVILIFQLLLVFIMRNARRYCRG